ncbi:MAG: aspartate kinase [Bifidobacteriaceae bacterium]|jgi:aspartate kinase|nr:aspartate kinase [Bifidobacteriaceae bacterium]
MKVVKFGGSSLADAAQIGKALAIVAAEPERRFVVASAPGKRSADDVKVTDLLYRLQAEPDADRPATLARLRDRFGGIVNDLGVALDLGAEFALIERQLTLGAGPDYFASRGEYLNSKIIAAKLGWPFVDAAEVVRFDAAGQLLPEPTDAALAAALGGLDRAVVPGFYGAGPDGRVKTFTRGGSDITGALVARAVRADVYENWTDVSGVLMADPRVVEAPAPIRLISYADLRRLAAMGASVLHEAAVEPVRLAGIPINVRNTNRPADQGTWIQAEAPAPAPGAAPIVGLAGKVGFALIGVVESGARPSQEVAAAMARALAGAGVKVRFQAAQDGLRVVAVDSDRYEDAVRAMYRALVADYQ